MKLERCANSAIRERCGIPSREWLFYNGDEI